MIITYIITHCNFNYRLQGHQIMAKYKASKAGNNMAGIITLYSFQKD